jgi:hypothetical protein
MAVRIISGDEIISEYVIVTSIKSAAADVEMPPIDCVFVKLLESYFKPSEMV